MKFYSQPTIMSKHSDRKAIFGAAWWVFAIIGCSSLLCGCLVPFLVYMWLVSAGYSKTHAAGILLALCVLSAILNTVSGMAAQRRYGEKDGPP